MEAAVALFVQLGYERTTLADIAERAGITTSLLRHYFAHKSDIADEVVAEDSVHLQRALDALGSVLEGARSTAAFLEQAGEQYAEWIAGRLWYYTVWTSADAKRLEEHPYSVADQMNRIHRFVAKRLSEMHDFKGSDEDALLAIRALFGSIIYSQLLGLRMGRPPARDELRAEIKRLSTMIALDVTS